MADETYEFETVKDGLWGDPKTWKDGRIPGYQPGRILIQHRVVIENDWGVPDTSSPYAAQLNALHPSAGYSKWPG